MSSVFCYDWCMQRINVRAIIIHENKLLLVKHTPYAGEANDYYNTIGGGLDDNEDLVKGLEREVLEETGVTATVGRLLFVQQYTDARGDTIEFFFHITNDTAFQTIDLTKTTHGEKEIQEIGFFDPKTITVLPAFLKEIETSALTANPDVLFFNYIKK